MSPRNMPLSALLAHNVRQRREKLGLSQVELASKAQLDAGALSRIENGHTGERGIGLNRIARLAAALGVAPSTLLES